MIAVGVLIPVGRGSTMPCVGAASALRPAAGLLLTGGIAALVYAYLVRFFAVALQAVEAGLAKITPRMDHAARTLGASPAQTLAARARAAACAAAWLTAALLVFVDVMKELPATFVMRPFNFDTLAIAGLQPGVGRAPGRSVAARAPSWWSGLLPL